MTIEFADPGYNFLFVWVPLIILVLGIAATIVVWRFIDDAAAPIVIIPILIMIFGPVIGTGEYSGSVRFHSERNLEELGFSDVHLSGDRFTAATEDGKYFSGVLVDLRPESGYAYQVLELKGTEN